MVEIMEDYALFLEAKERLEKENDGQTVSMEAVMKQFGITQDNLDEVEVELDNSQRLLVLKAVQKVQINPLPDYEGGYGKPLGNHLQSKLAEKRLRDVGE